MIVDDDFVHCVCKLPGDEWSAAARAPGGAQKQRLTAEVDEAGHHEHGVQVEAVLQLLVGAAAAAAPQEGRGEPRLPRLRDPVLVPAEDADPEEDEGEGAVEEDLCQQVEQPEAAFGS